MGIIFTMPLPQMLHITIIAKAKIASGQLVAALLMALGASIRPIDMMIGPVTIGGKNLITLLMPKDFTKNARITYINPANTTPPQA